MTELVSGGAVRLPRARVSRRSGTTCSGWDGAGSCSPKSRRLNITAFDGDLGAVTLAEQSAGGISAMTPFTAPHTQSLFRAAICMSGVDRVQSMAHTQERRRDQAASAGVEPTVAGWSR
ncbi:carboxylesterase family protein [Streptomyces sp. SID10815]|uniref:carboxylesterase family protein n=1 Tax=Streptomyces sp. SID10815 TaxID=2706027 RepID=UPI0013C95944|nr:carboxylesterase family protein [Streptomyces sp. SID10815]